MVGLGPDGTQRWSERHWSLPGRFGSRDRGTKVAGNCSGRRKAVGEASERPHVLLMPRDLIHRAVTDLDNHVIGYVRDLLID
jgi:hypothetical protein